TTPFDEKKFLTVQLHFLKRLTKMVVQKSKPKEGKPKVYGIHSSAKFHHKPTDRLTEEEFQETIKFYENFDIDTLFSQDDEDKYDES
ncbi:hypothetical protein P9689_002681, partial [Enterococcus faecalis]|nr:hypothetical protein [Enterococcus faecalis]